MRQTSPSSASFRAPDGSTVTLRVSGYDLSGMWDSTVRITTNRPYAGAPEGLQLREFHVTPTGNYDRVLDYAIKGTWVNKVEAQSGHFLVGHSETADQGLAIWRGQWHEAATWLDAPTMPAGVALQRFNGLRFVDSPAGLVVESSFPETETVEAIEVSKIIPGVGYLDIRKPEDGLGLVPNWSGVAVQTGEVWKTDLPDGPANVSLVHASRSAVTILTADGTDKGYTAARLEFLERLVELSWN